jgi:hypothetical protein
MDSLLISLPFKAHRKSRACAGRLNCYRNGPPGGSLGAFGGWLVAGLLRICCMCKNLYFFLGHTSLTRFNLARQPLCSTGGFSDWLSPLFLDCLSWFAEALFSLCAQRDGRHATKIDRQRSRRKQMLLMRPLADVAAFPLKDWGLIREGRSPSVPY